MKILNVNVLLDPVFGGGTAERTYQMSKALEQVGADCIILTTNVGLTEERVASLQGVRVIALPCILKRFFIVRFSWSKLEEIVASVDIIHLMGHWSMLNALVYLLAKKIGTPYVICPAGELQLFGRSRWIKKLFNIVVGYRLVREAAGYIAVTSDEIPVYERYGVNPESVTVIPNGVNEKDFQPDVTAVFSRQFGLGDSPFILFMGRLNPIKGPDLLLDAFCLIANQFPTYHLVFAGPDGGLLTSLQRTVKDKGIDKRVHFIGYVAGKDKVSVYHEADFLVIPSRQEAMSIVVLEAGICRAPVLLTNSCGFNEVDEIGGGKVVQATINGLSEGLAEMLSKQDSLVEMGERLRHFVINNYTWDIICQRYLALYNKIKI